MEDKTKILLVEDDRNLGMILTEYLELKGYIVTREEDGEKGFRKFFSEKFDLCILDIMMPRKDGFTLAKEIRDKDKNTPLIFLTAKSMQKDKLEGLRLGGDDYITKPFSSEELLLRINNIIRRVNNFPDKGLKPGMFQIGKYLFDYNKRALRIDNQELKLTTREAELLKLFSENANQIVYRTDALKQIWKEDNYYTARSMDVFIVKLRRYLRHDKSVEIANVHGSGFKLIS
jgi:two-component system, OmpR family, response regulator